MVLVGSQYLGIEYVLDGFDTVHPRHPYNTITRYTTNDGEVRSSKSTNKTKFTSFRKAYCTPCLYPLGELYLGLWVSETIAGEVRDDLRPSDLALGQIPRHVSKLEQVRAGVGLHILR